MDNRRDSLLHRRNDSDAPLHGIFDARGRDIWAEIEAEMDEEISNWIEYVRDGGRNRRNPIGVGG